MATYACFICGQDVSDFSLDYYAVDGYRHAHWSCFALARDRTYKKLYGTTTPDDIIENYDPAQWEKDHPPAEECYLCELSADGSCSRCKQPICLRHTHDGCCPSCQ